MSMFRRRLLMQQAMSVPDPIAKYDPTGHTNEDMAEYPVLTDLTGNGHDITCHNFAWSGMSGIGGYLVNLLYSGEYKYESGADVQDIERFSDKIIITNIKSGSRGCIYSYNTGSDGQFVDSNVEVPSFKVKISGLPNNTLVYQYISEDGTNRVDFPLVNGINILPKSNVYNGSSAYISHGFYILSTAQLGECNITIEQLPLYGNALVSDGVDDYGICENFPILTKEKGYTVVALRKWLDYSGQCCFIANGNGSTGSFLFERIEQSGEKRTYNFNSSNKVNEYPELTTYQNSIEYNGLELTIGTPTATTNNLKLFNLASGYSKIALYALEIYDRDLTPYQIEAVKKRLMDEYNNPEDTTSDWYGVEWYTDDPQSSVRRIGNVNLHKSLPIQSGMYRCILNDNGEEVYKLDPNDSTKKEDGTAAVLDGTDGQVMVYIPVFYARFESKGYRRRVKLSDHYKPGFIKMGGCYVSAYEATVDRTIQTLIKLASVVNTTADFRGGNNNSKWDNTYRSLLGMPATATSLTNFRNYARNRNNGDTQWNCMDYTAYKAIYWLYIVEYADRNSQLAFNDELTAEGYRQGGLGAGVTDINGSKWSAFNDYYPFIPCGHTNSLGNKTGVVAFIMPDEYDAETPLTTYVPSYRGIENPFGHIWKWTDGIHIRVQSEEAGGKSILYTSDNPANYQDTDYEGYEEKGYISRTKGYVKDILFGEEGDMLVKEGGATGASSTTYFSDYFYTNIPTSGEVLRGVMFGGNARNGTSAGFSFASLYNAPSTTAADVGSRLCYIPNN